MARYLTIKEIRPAKTMVELVAEIGGHLGLLVGVSVLTLVEGIELLCKLLQGTIHRHRVHVVDTAV